MIRPSKPIAFRSPAAFRKWLMRHRATPELVVRCFKTHASHRGMTYSQALDEALCFGWIDGVRRSIDEDSFSVRFSPRRSGSKWSRVNIRRFSELAGEKRVHASGHAAFLVRTDYPRPYSYESRPVKLDAAYTRKLRADASAAEFFEQQPPGYRRLIAFWIMSAKQEATRERRLGILIKYSRRGRRIPPLEPPKSRAKH